MQTSKKYSMIHWPIDDKEIDDRDKEIHEFRHSWAKSFYIKDCTQLNIPKNIYLLVQYVYVHRFGKI